MSTRLSLEEFEIATPCPANWAAMEGDDRVRFCRECSKFVYDISTMSRSEAESLIVENSGGEICVKLFRRWDGRVITSDCPVGVAIKQRSRIQTYSLVAFGLPMFWLLVSLPGLLSGRRDPFSLTSYEPFRFLDYITTRPQPPQLMGMISVPKNPTPPSGKADLPPSRFEAK